MSRNQIAVLGGTVLVGILAVIALFTLFGSSPGGGDALAATGQAAVKALPTDHTLGSLNAPVVVLEYAAPSCPVCARFNAETMPLLKKNYIDTGKVLYIFRVFPLRPADGAAEGLARCLTPDSYFAFLDLLFRSQSDWDPEYGIADVHGALIQKARITGMSAKLADACMADRANAELINKNAQDAVTRYSVAGTPTLVINGVPQQAGAIPYPQLKATLDAFLVRK